MRANFGYALAIFLIGFSVGLIVGFKSCSRTVSEVRITRDTVLVPLKDTLIVVKPRIAYRDTGSTRLVPVDVTVLQHDTICKPFKVVGDTITSDSAKIVPTFSYPSLNFSVWYKPPPERVITIEKTVTIVPKPDTFILGIGPGYSLVEVDGSVKARASIGIGIYYKLTGY